MSNYDDDDQIVKNLRRSYPGQWPDNASGEEVWGDYVLAFTKMPRANRSAVLNIAGDVLLGGAPGSEDLKPSRETATLINKKRELTDIHEALWNMGR